MNDPAHDDFHDIIGLFDGQFPASWDMVPFLKAAAAAAGRGMLGKEDRMAFHRCLLPVVRYISRPEALLNEVIGMSPYGVLPFETHVFLVFLREAEAGAERGPGESFFQTEPFVICHGMRLAETAGIVKRTARGL